MIGALYVDAFVCGICDTVTFLRARTGTLRVECLCCKTVIEITEDDRIVPTGSRIVRDLEFWQK